MSKYDPDYQKREARKCRWNLDGGHTAKAARNKGKGRQRDKGLIATALAELETEDSL